MRVLGIDYGRKNLGFALADTPFATPHSVAKIDSMTEAIATTTKLIEQTRPDLIVVGIPEGEIAEDVQYFVAGLSPLTPHKVVTHPETLSSVEAVAKLRQASANKNKLKSNHAYAAALILEDYLDLHPDLVKI